ncbi:putative carboxylesterase 18 [Dichanthelium oligosanthes]|uniref:Putative carboxylesterase 18 n=1 Tax=Dichanthelium oligosanthes TaxID=888268 RepID=A0A1E5VYW5_9POAL|nr:putative carboxylesterase 18 [Dichanthelium oligosanthes]
MAAPDPPPRPGKPPLPWRARLLVGAASALHWASLRGDGTVNRFLLSLFDRAAPPTPAPVTGVASTDHAISDHLRVRLFTPTTAGDDDSKHHPVVVYFHGGGFVFHSAASAQFDALCRRLASAIPAVIASVDYRLAPEHRFPAPYDDGEAALRWVLAGAGGALPSPPAAVFVAGDSAGGNIAHHVAARLPNNVAGLVALQPFFGGEAPTESELRLRDAPFGAPGRLSWLWRAFLPPGATRDHEAANVPDAIRRDADGGEGRWRAFPPTVVCVGGWDVHQDRQRAYADALRSAGAEEVTVAEYPDAIHAFYMLDELADSKKLVADVAEFVNWRVEQLEKRELDHARD